MGAVRRSLWVLRCRKDRTGGRCAGGSASARIRGTNGWRAGWRARRDWRPSRRPHAALSAALRRLEAPVLAVRDAHPAWGARKIAAVWRGGDRAAGGLDGACDPARHGLIVRRRAQRAHHGSRRRRPTFCGRWTSRAGCGWATAARCHPLTVVDDHSRYCWPRACADEQGADGAAAGADVSPVRPAERRSSSTTAPPGACSGGTGRGSASGW